MGRLKQFSRAFDETAQEQAPGPRGPEATSAEDLERLKAQGYRASDVNPITVVFDRHDFAELLRFIEERAVRAENYFEVRQAVLFSEMLRSQGRKQGF